jgi:hypothetical protein
MRQQTVNRVSVTPQQDKLTFLVNTDNVDGRKVSLQVGTGCEVLVYINNAYDSTINVGEEVIKWRATTKHGKKIKFIGITCYKEFKLGFGIGEIPYHDVETDLDPLIGVCIECRCRLVDGRALRDNFTFDDIDATMVNENLRTTIQSRLCKQFAEVLRGKRYNAVFGCTQELADSMRTEVSAILRKYGIELVDCSARMPVFPMGYNEQRTNKK